MDARDRWFCLVLRFKGHNDHRRSYRFRRAAFQDFSYYCQKTMICPLCSTPLNHRLDDTYFACRECQGVVMDEQHYLTSDQERAHYETHVNDVHDVRYQQFTAPIWKYILANFQPMDVGLDFGSGTGPVISKVLQDHGFHVEQYDPFFAPDASVLDQPYQYIFSCEVIEHFFHPRAEFERLVQLLLPGGALILMTHIWNSNIDFQNWYYRKDPTHVFIYREETMRYIAREFGLEIHEMDERLVVFRVKRT